MSTLLTIYVWFSILVLVTYILVILQAAATIKRKYPDYHGKKVPKIELIFGFLKIVILPFIPLLNILIFWVIMFHTNKLIDGIIEKAMEGD